jgi:hypothetical protein
LNAFDDALRELTRALGTLHCLEALFSGDGANMPSRAIVSDALDAAIGGLERVHASLTLLDPGSGRASIAAQPAGRA